MTDDKMREAFLTWARAYDLSFEVRRDGTYVRPHTQTAWDAWQAATLAEAQQRGREIASDIAKCVEKGDRMEPAMLIFEHEDFRRITCRADDARLVGEPAWHRVGPAGALPEVTREAIRREIDLIRVGAQRFPYGWSGTVACCDAIEAAMAVTPPKDPKC